MPSEIPIPAGYVTRSRASALFNRSRRQLQRDLDKALLTNDADVLANYKLVTKDGTLGDATTITKNSTQKLQEEGEMPTWCINESWLEETFGRKGEPMPTKTKPQQDEPEDRRTQDGTGQLDSLSSNVRGDVDFLKEQIRLAEQRYQQEVERNKERERQLFAQLAVKDKQISSWDELTQGIVRGIATGQLKPELSLNLRPDSASIADASSAADVQDVTPSLSKTRTDSKTKKGRAKTVKSSAQKKGSRSKLKTGFAKHTPTLHKAVSRIFSR